ncbi:hypothetical protein [uncultured Chryseobacterium sp.]|uniref:hypothetical protein n=1 Tax=uncultured Chryseobacterium sp. TaxID=259322 RepID=UPI0025E5FD52|nr:hypothetical protein [uncultured Chryseobacterium sp.]
MTLCTAYIRQVNDTEELIFATDSELTGGGEKWDKGVKLFELPNKDALLCFTGTTSRAYPLILNLISSISYEDIFFKISYTLEDLKDHILQLFSTLIRSITDIIDDKHSVRGEAKFLFGGWDWKLGQFRIWIILYDAGEEKFLATELTESSDRTNFYVFIGEAKDIDAEEWANEELTKLLIKDKKLHMKFDMEPLKIIRTASLDKDITGIGGSLQIAKVYKSNKTEFFGVYWHSVKGRPFFQGREYNEIDKPIVRYFDPDTFEIIESDLPERLITISEELYGEDCDFVQGCFDEEGFLRLDLPEKTKYKLKLIFKGLAYRLFIEQQSKIGEEK